MKISILLRGQHFLEENTPRSNHTNPVRTTFFDHFQNFQDMICQPLAEHDLTFYIATYSSPIQNRLTVLADRKKTLITSIRNFGQCTQIDTITRGLNLIPKNQNNIILVFRFDLVYKQPITNWLNLHEEFDIRLLWRCCTRCDLWQSHRLVADTFFAINNKNDVLARFKKSILETDYGDPPALHEIYNPLISNQLDVKFCYEEIYDTNTTTHHPESNNPVYTMHNRRNRFIKLL